MAKKRDEQMKEITERLEQGVEEMFTSERYTEYLRTMAQFHNYSFNNTVLIAAQRPDATLVAGYQAWQKKFNRQVKRGEKGIQIIAPVPVREREEREKTDENGEVILRPDGQPETETVEYVVPRFRVATVFDVSQTYGEPLPGIDINDLTAGVENYALFMDAIRQVSPVPIRFDEIASGARGYYSNDRKEIVIQSGMSESQTMKTAIHEVTHAKLHDRDIMEGLGEQKNQTTREVEAESVAFAVCDALGLDTSEYSFPYIAGWSSGMELKELRSSMDTIRHTSAEMLDEITEAMRELQREHPHTIVESAQDRTMQQTMEEPEEYEEIEIFEVPALFSNGRIRQEDVTEGMYRYDLRGSDYDPGEPVTVENNVAVNHAASILTPLPLPIPERGYLRLGDGLNFVGGMMTVPEFQKLYAEMDTAALTEKMADAVGAENEELLLEPDAASGRYAIYQLDPHGNGDDKRFMNLEYIRSHNGEVLGNEYRLIYSGILSSQDTPDSLYQRFNVSHPEGYTGHSLSVSDVVLMNRDGQVQAYFVDSFGFAELPDFVRQRQDMLRPKEPVQVTEQTSGLFAEGHEGTWHTIDRIELEGESFFLMEHDEYGDEAACIAVNENGELVAEDLWNGFDEGFHEAVKEYFEDKGIVYEPEAVREEVNTAEAEQSEVSKIMEPEQAPEAKTYPAIYLHTGAYAREHGELDVYRESRKTNAACKEAIEQSIRDNFDGMYLKDGAAKAVIAEFGAERVELVLATTIRKKEYDGRFSRNNKDWANTIQDIPDTDAFRNDRRTEYVVESHPAVLDGFIGLARQEILEQSREQAAKSEMISNEGLEHGETAYELPDGRSLLLERINGGYEYTVYQADMDILDVGTYLDAGFAFSDMLDDLAADFGFEVSELREIPYESFMEKLDAKSQETAVSADEQQIDAVSRISDRTEPAVSLHGKSMAEIEETVLCYAQAQIDQMGLHDEVELLGARVYGSRSREGLSADASDVDVVLSYTGNLREDSFFAFMHEDGLTVAGITVDINSVSAERQTMEQFMQNAEQYPDEKAAQMTTAPEQEKPEPALSFYVAECMEFPVLGEYHEGLTMQEAVALYQQIPSTRMNGIKGIGFDLQDGSIYEGKHELMSAGVIHTEDINAIPHFHDSPLVQGAVAELDALLSAREEPVRDARREEKTAAAEPEKLTQTAPKTDRPEQAGGSKKESVLQALRERQAKIKQTGQDKQKSQMKKKGEQEL